MSRSLRYFLYALAFALGLLGLVVAAPVVKIVLIVVAIPVGVVADLIETHYDQPYRQYSLLHGHYRKHAEN